MKLSIIIPTFNSSKVIGRALDSIVAQTFGDWEVLVMDGASKDNTGEIVKSYNDERIKLYSEPDKGIYDAMNKGIKKAQGEWLYFLGSDDWLYDDEVFSYFFRDNDFSEYDVVYGDVDAPQLGDKYKGKWTLDNLKYNRCHQAIFYKSYIFERLGLYNLKYKLLADFDINLKWILNAKIKSKYVRKIVAYYSDGGASSSCNDEKFMHDYYRLIYFRGRKIIEPKYMYMYLDAWTFARKQGGHRFIYCGLFCYLLIYRIVHKL